MITLGIKILKYPNSNSFDTMQMVGPFKILSFLLVFRYHIKMEHNCLVFQSPEVAWVWVFFNPTVLNVLLVKGVQVFASWRDKSRESNMMSRVHCFVGGLSEKKADIYYS